MNSNDRYKITSENDSVRFDNSENFSYHDLINLFDIYLNKCDNFEFISYCFNKICKLFNIDTESVFSSGYVLNSQTRTRLIYKIFIEKLPNNSINEKFF